MGNILTSEQRTALKSRHGNERDRRVCDRIKAVLLYDKGWSYGEMAEALLLSEEAIYFMDSVHPQYQTKARYGWIRKNQNKTLPTFSGWKRKHLIGAINLSDLQLVSTDNPKVSGDYIINFLQKLEAENPNKEKIYLICDNARYHKSKTVKEYLVNSKIELVFLPPYSPNLNPIERLWKFMHRIVTNNKFYHNFAQFSEAIDRFFANIDKYKGNLLTLITDQFQTITFNHFANSSG
ncbi:IS630 family transposase [Candidatus Tisiphia endosymbiont of Ptychoptera albimana]|uniref:IS630 family transposase n=1 Tax=Candidatus Tisiphia endosymbiont of Ptychoptera albimana TaxID=3066260 RepID=UPI00312C8644